MTQFWLSRKSLTSLSQDVIIRIGRRLVEVRFFHGHVESAIELGEDILYNVQRVYGTTHPSTVDIASLLSTMYAATGDHTAAKAVIGDRSPYRKNSDRDVVPTVLHAPSDWGFIDDDEKGLKDVQQAR